MVRDESGISMLEFGLLLPIFLGMVIAGLEMSQNVIANQRMQRIAANLGDLVAQSGTASIGMSETQINDIFASLDYSAAPFDLRGRGRVIITAVQGQRDPADSNRLKNRKLWHRCDGSLTGQANVLPGAVGSVVVLPNNRQLLEGEILIHSQLAYNYEPLFGVSIGNLWDPRNQFIRRMAVFRPRSKTFVSITPDGSTAKSNCPTA
jgi:hypothetical protein